MTEISSRPTGDAAGQAAVVIVHYRSYADLSACLASIETWDTTRHVVVVDHASVPDSVRSLQQRFPWVRLLATSENPGFAVGVNRGVRACDTPYVLVLNPDCVLHGPARAPLAACLDRTPDVGVVGPRLRNADETHQPSARRFPDITTALGGRRSWLTAVAPGNWLSRRNLVSTAADTAPKAVDWVSGACMMIRRTAFDQIGGLDERFFLYWEDADFCRRLAGAGWRTLWHPDAAITHVGARCSRFAPGASLVAFHRSAYRYYWKHAGPIGRSGAPLVALMLALRLALAFTYTRTREGLQTWLPSRQP